MNQKGMKVRAQAKVTMLLAKKVGKRNSLQKISLISISRRRTNQRALLHENLCMTVKWFRVSLLQLGKRMLNFKKETLFNESLVVRNMLSKKKLNKQQQKKKQIEEKRGRQEMNKSSRRDPAVRAVGPKAGNQGNRETRNEKKAPRQEKKQERTPPEPRPAVKAEKYAPGKVTFKQKLSSTPSPVSAPASVPASPAYTPAPEVAPAPAPAAPSVAPDSGLDSVSTSDSTPAALTPPASPDRPAPSVAPSPSSPSQTPDSTSSPVDASFSVSSPPPSPVLSAESTLPAPVSLSDPSPAPSSDSVAPSSPSSTTSPSEESSLTPAPEDTETLNPASSKSDDAEESTPELLPTSVKMSINDSATKTLSGGNASAPFDPYRAPIRIPISQTQLENSPSREWGGENTPPRSSPQTTSPSPPDTTPTSGGGSIPAHSQQWPQNQVYMRQGMYGVPGDPHEAYRMGPNSDLNMYPFVTQSMMPMDPMMARMMKPSPPRQVWEHGETHGAPAGAEGESGKDGSVEMAGEGESPTAQGWHPQMDSWGYPYVPPWQSMGMIYHYGSNMPVPSFGYPQNYRPVNSSQPGKTQQGSDFSIRPSHLQGGGYAPPPHLIPLQPSPEVLMSMDHPPGPGVPPSSKYGPSWSQEGDDSNKGGDGRYADYRSKERLPPHGNYGPRKRRDARGKPQGMMYDRSGKLLGDKGGPLHPYSHHPPSPDSNSPVHDEDVSGDLKGGIPQEEASGTSNFEGSAEGSTASSKLADSDETGNSLKTSDGKSGDSLSSSPSSSDSIHLHASPSLESGEQRSTTANASEGSSSQSSGTVEMGSAGEIDTRNGGRVITGGRGGGRGGRDQRFDDQRNDPRGYRRDRVVDRGRRGGAGMRGGRGAHPRVDAHPQGLHKVDGTMGPKPIYADSYPSYPQQEGEMAHHHHHFNSGPLHDGHPKGTGVLDVNQGKNLSDAIPFKGPPQMSQHKPVLPSRGQYRRMPPSRMHHTIDPWRGRMDADRREISPLDHPDRTFRGRVSFRRGGRGNARGAMGPGPTDQQQIDGGGVMSSSVDAFSSAYGRGGMRGKRGDRGGLVGARTTGRGRAGSSSSPAQVERKADKRSEGKETVVSGNDLKKEGDGNYEEDGPGGNKKTEMVVDETDVKTGDKEKENKDEEGRGGSEGGVNRQEAKKEDEEGAIKEKSNRLSNSSEGSNRETEKQELKKQEEGKSKEEVKFGGEGLMNEGNETNLPLKEEGLSLPQDDLHS
mmetsp:Transcript_24748/g.34053  ORF Transcript_24748/g.34053 Transcript_24748/m.34053 type:complete len:1237 (+) Transcript_24748:2041-5751(+)